MDSLFKLCDVEECGRLCLWFTPFREQAGGHERQGCLEHMVALHLIIDLCRRKEISYYVSLINFSSARSDPRETMVFDPG